MRKSTEETEQEQEEQRARGGEKGRGKYLEEIAKRSDMSNENRDFHSPLKS